MIKNHGNWNLSFLRNGKKCNVNIAYSQHRNLDHEAMVYYISLPRKGYYITHPEFVNKKMKQDEKIYFRVLCIKDYFMDSGEIAFIKGKEYTYRLSTAYDNAKWPFEFYSEICKHNITNDSDHCHRMSKKELHSVFINPDDLIMIQDKDLDIDI